jgi:hypothetical protein
MGCSQSIAALASKDVEFEEEYEEDAQMEAETT